MNPLKTVRPACEMQNGPRGFDQLGSDQAPHTPTDGQNQQPRPYQADLMDQIRAQYRAGLVLRVLLQLPTGAGKTFIFCRIAAGAVAKDRRVWLLGHRAEILTQISDALYALGIDHGVLEGGQQDTSARILAASIATMARRLDRYKDTPPDLLIVDEAHHAVAGSWRKILAAFPNARVLGVTATPERLDGRGLGDIFQAMIVGPDVAELTRQQYLVPAVVYAPSVAVDLSGVRTRAGDYASDDLAKVMGQGALVGDAIEHYKTLGDGVPAIAFAVNVAHSQQIAARFNAAGIPAAHVDGETPAAERKHFIAALGSGKLKVLCNCGLISEGVDVPIVGAAILMRPTQSLGLYLQMVGRALRPAPGKTRAIILDHAGNSLRHGLPADPREWSLKGKARQQRDQPHERRLRHCKACGAVNAVGAMRCVGCGAELKPTSSEQREINAKLIAAERNQMIRETRAMTYQEARRFADSADKARLVAFAKGWRPGWVWYRVRELEVEGRRA
jgi:superfamily II DNA or RNA helicase